jgi:hypothetical protein
LGRIFYGEPVSPAPKNALNCSSSYSAKALCEGKMGMNILIGVLITFVVVILVLYLVNMLPIDGRARQIVRAIVIVIGIISLLKYLAIF